MNHNSAYWTNKLDSLEAQVTSDQTIARQVMFNWVAECLATFSLLGVNSEIIKGFMELFSDPDGYTKTPAHYAYENWTNPSRQADRVRGFFYPNIAFTTARGLVSKLSDQERLVPVNLIVLLKSKPQYTHLATSLESIQAAYEAQDIENLLTATSGLLQAILNLHPEVAAKRDLKAQLTHLTPDSQKTIRQQFGVGKDLVETLQLFRYLRNSAQHKRQTTSDVIEPVPPLSVGYGFASLVLIFLHSTIGQGHLIEVN